MSETTCSTCPSVPEGEACPKCGRKPDVIASLARPTLRTGKTENLRLATQRLGRSGVGARPAAALPATLAARFEDLGVLGAGGMGVVMRARDRQIGREVAIKLISPEAPLAGDLRREATLLATFEDERVVRLYEYGEADGAPYFVMELVRGETLFSRLMLSRPPLTEALAIARDITRAVEAAHARGIIHSDLKPANVFLEPGGRAKVADFGLARALPPAATDEHGKPTEPRYDLEADIKLSGIAGTPGYMAPEQARAQEPRPPSDVYALGVMIHEMLTGQRLFTGRTVLSILKRQASGDPPGPATVNPGVPPELDALVTRCLAQEPGARPTAAELSRELEKWETRLKRARALPGAAGLPPHPYKFLEPFEAADARIFFGRESEIAELTALITAPSVRIVLVFGPCGVGKSSLVRAGLARSLADEGLPALVVNAGPDPARRLTEALAARPETRVLMVDQLDELFTMNRPDAPAVRRFLELAIGLAEDGASPVKVVLSFRSEFRAQLFALETRLAKLAQPYAVGPLSEAALADAIEGPSWIETYGFQLEPGFARALTRDILETVAERGESAPALAQIVCRQLYDHARAAGIAKIGPALYGKVLGGAKGALTRYVEERLQGPTYGPEAPLARQLMRALTHREGGGERYARPTEEDELLAFPDPERARRVLGLLVRDRLVTTDEGEGGRRIFRLCSEVICPLIDAWGPEVDESERAARVLQRAVRVWVDHGRRHEDLPGGTALALVEKHFDALRGVGEPERALLAHARAARRNRRIGAAALALVVALVVGTAGWLTLLKPGRVSVASDPPGADVYSGEQHLGVTPLTWSAWPGVHQLTLRKERHAATELTVRVPAGGEATYVPVLSYPYGMLAVESDPIGASVTVSPLKGTGGSPVTTTTPTRLELPAGRYALKVSAPGHVDAAVDELTVVANRSLAERRLRLVPDHGWLDLDTPFPGTTATVREPKTGRVLWTATLPVRGRQTPRGRFLVEASLLGHHTQVKSVEVMRGTTSTYTLWTPSVEQRWKTTIKGGRMPRRLPDLDADGRADVLTILDKQDLQVTSGRDGHALFAVTLDVTPRETEPLMALDAVNLDGKGRTGAIASFASGTVLVVDLADRKVLGRVTAKMPDLTGEQPLAPRAVDLDGDRASEIVGLNGDHVVVYQASDQRVRWTVPVRKGIGGFTIGDVDADGVQDVVVSGNPFYAQALSGKDGHALWTMDGPAAQRNFDCPVVAGVIAGSAGRVDVAITGAGGTGGVGVIDGRTGKLRWEQTGTVVTGLNLIQLPGRQGADVVTVMDGNIQVHDGASGAIVWQTPVVDPIAHLMVVDFLGDGRSSVVTVLQDGRFFVYDGSGGWLRWSLGGGSQFGDRPLFTDVDGDGTLDLIFADDSRGVVAYSGAPDAVRWAARAGARAFGSPLALDADGDGQPEVVSLVQSRPDLTLSVFSGLDGRGLWSRSVPLGDTSFAAGAFTKAGAVELAVTAADRGVEVRGAVDGKRRWGDLPGSPIAGDPLVMAADGGRADLVVRQSTSDAKGSSHLVRRDGRDGRELWRSVAIPFARRSVEILKDGQGRPPVIGTVVWGPQGSAGKAHLGIVDPATGAVLETLQPGLDQRAAAMIAADLDGDGVDEIVTAYQSGLVEAWSRKSGRVWSVQSLTMDGEPAGKVPEDLAPPNLAANDADGDGAADVVVCSAMGRLATVSGRTGKQLWLCPDRISAARVMVTPFDRAVPSLIMNDSTGRLQVRDGADGKLLGTLVTSDSDTSSPSVYDPARPVTPYGGDRHAGLAHRGPAPAGARLLCVGQADTLILLPVADLARSFAR